MYVLYSECDGIQQSTVQKHQLTSFVMIHSMVISGIRIQHLGKGTPQNRIRSALFAVDIA